MKHLFTVVWGSVVRRIRDLVRTEKVNGQYCCVGQVQKS